MNYTPSRVGRRIFDLKVPEKYRAVFHMGILKSLGFGEYQELDRHILTRGYDQVRMLA